MSTLIKLQDVKKDYTLGKSIVPALRGVSLEIKKGEFLAIAGSSGSGKSTLLNLIGCLDIPSSGEVWIDETRISGLSDGKLNQIRSKAVGFIFQSFNLIPVLNVYENIELPLLTRKEISSKEKRERINYLIDAVGLTQKAKHKPSELSGGQRQRVAVARALVTKAQIVLADEPTANLDSKMGLEIIELMSEINRKESTTFIFSTHDHKVLEKANRILYLEDGLISREEIR